MSMNFNDQYAIVKQQLFPAPVTASTGYHTNFYPWREGMFTHSYSWVETDPVKGQTFRCTKFNPATNEWTKFPLTTQYHDIVVMVLYTTGIAGYKGFRLGQMSSQEIQALATNYKLTEYQLGVIRKHFEAPVYVLPVITDDMLVQPAPTTEPKKRGRKPKVRPIEDEAAVSNNEPIAIPTIIYSDPAFGFQVVEESTSIPAAIESPPPKKRGRPSNKDKEEGITESWAMKGERIRLAVQPKGEEVIGKPSVYGELTDKMLETLRDIAWYEPGSLPGALRPGHFISQKPAELAQKIRSRPKTMEEEMQPFRDMNHPNIPSMEAMFLQTEEKLAMLDAQFRDQEYKRRNQK